MSRVRTRLFSFKEPLRIGFVPVTDCAPIVCAQETGLFAKYELDVELRRETTWSSILDKLVNGDLDAAHAPATLPFIANSGIDSDPGSCVSGMVLSLQGNAITLSRKLWDRGIHNAETLREYIYSMWGKRTVSLGVVFPFSSPSFLLHHWLTAAGINPDTQVRILVVPPSQMYPMLKLGYIDGFCAGEPWTSVAVQAGVGVCVASSAQLAPLHPEKVLMVRQSFSLGRAEIHERLLASLLEACAFCDEPENRTLLCDMLAGPQYVNAPAESLKAGLVGPYNVGDQVFDSYNQGNIFHRFNANDPSDEKAEWIMHNIYTLLDRKFTRKYAAKGQEVLKNVFRKDAFERAKALVATEAQRLMDETLVNAPTPSS